LPLATALRWCTPLLATEPQQIVHERVIVRLATAKGFVRNFSPEKMSLMEYEPMVSGTKSTDAIGCTHKLAADHGDQRHQGGVGPPQSENSMPKVEEPHCDVLNSICNQV
jgi:hypothetical protein